MRLQPCGQAIGPGADGARAEADHHVARAGLFANEALEVNGADAERWGAEQLVFDRRVGGGEVMRCVVNFAAAACDVPAGMVLLTSDALTDEGQLPTDTAVWVLLDGSAQ